MSTRIGWIKRRARQFTREFNTPRHKAVRYAADDWKAFKGRKLTCEELGVCQARENCGCSKGPFTARPSRSMADFRRFLSRSTGGAS